MVGVHNSFCLNTHTTFSYGWICQPKSNKILILVILIILVISVILISMIFVTMNDLNIHCFEFSLVWFYFGKSQIMTYHKVYNSKWCAVNQSAAIYARKTIIIINLFSC